MNRPANPSTSRRSARRALLTTALPALAAAVLLAVLGVLDVVHAVLLVVVVAAVVHVWRTLDEGVQPPWPDPPDDRRAGARSDVSELGWATFTRDGTVGGRMLGRVRYLAAARLAEHGVDLADPASRPAAARLLGTEVVDGMAAGRHVSKAEVNRWLDALEALEPPQPAQHGPQPAPTAPDERPAS